MKSVAELREIINHFKPMEMNAHVHTHLCDGTHEMTVDNIAREACAKGIGLTILTPHCHHLLKEGDFSLYWDTDPCIFERLREKIETYQKKDGRVRFLLSSEVDILSMDGGISMEPSRQIECNLDMITVTMNFHPGLSIRSVELSYYHRIRELYDSGEAQKLMDTVGGKEKAMRMAYSAQASAIRSCPYPCALGHFWISHNSCFDGYNWSGLVESDLDAMKEGAAEVLDALHRRGGMLDVTGIQDPDQQWLKDLGLNRKVVEPAGFFREFHRWVLREAEKLEIPVLCGSDAHALDTIGRSRIYQEYFNELLKK